MRGIVRLSGPGTASVLSKLFQSNEDVGFAFASVARRWTGSLRLGRDWIASSVLAFPEARSYTGQAMAELHVLGAPTLLAMVLEQCVEHGARHAEPGEFTARAYLSGRLDLSQAHGVAGMIAAQTDQQLRAAERLLHGRLGEIAREAREDLADLLSLVEGAMDFADEPIEFIEVAMLRGRLAGIHEQLAATVSAGIRAERWGLLPRVVLVGPANAGKSSLLNRLSGSERAISAPVAGTTRDAISAPVDLGGGVCLLIDVAGAMETVGMASASHGSIDTQAGQMAADAAKSADLVVAVIDLADSGAMDAALRPWRDGRTIRIIAGNKADAASEERRAAFLRWSAVQPTSKGVVVSALTGDGCDALRSAISAALGDRHSTENDAAIALMAEHREALENALLAMDRAMELAARCDDQLNDADLVAAEMRIAAESLGTLVGMDQTEDMLGRVFSRFCVGK